MASQALIDAYRWNRQSYPLRSARFSLDMARRDVANGTRRCPSSTFGRSVVGPVSDDGGTWIEKTDSVGLRFVGSADEIANLRHQGWHTSEESWTGETLRGAVWQMPARDGRPQYVPGYADPNNDGAARLWFGDMIEGDKGGEEGESQSKRDAAYRADRIAERMAESERGYNEAFQYGSEWSDLGEEIAATRKRALKLARERKSMCAMLRDNPELETSHTFKLVCDAIRNAWDEITAARAKRAELSDMGSYAIRQGWHHAFNDGAGETVIRD